MTIQFNETLVKQLQEVAIKERKKIVQLLEHINTMDKSIRDHLLSWELRYFEKNPKVLNAIHDMSTHVAWNALFNYYALYNSLNSKDYSAAIMAYQLSDPSKCEYYKDIDRLTVFNTDNALRFFNTYLSDTPVRRKQTVSNFLEITGAEWKKRASTVTKKLTVRSLNDRGEGTKTFGNFVQLCCWLTDNNFSWNIYWNVMRANNAVNGEPFTVVDNLPITLEKHQNGNYTLRIDPELANQLNSYLN